MPARPRLKHHARPLRRSPSSLQFGLFPHAGLVVDGLSGPEIAVLQGLDGGLARTQLYAEAREQGVSTTRLDRLLAELRTHHLLVEEPADRAHLGLLPPDVDSDWQSNADAIAMAYELSDDGLRQLADRTGRRVAVRGRGGVPAAIAAALRAGGIGRVDLGQGPVDALERSLARLGGPRAEHGPDLVVLVARSALPPGVAATWVRHGIPHLPVLTQGHRIVVGPLVRPGDGPCLDCLDLHRRDRDPAWPSLLAQLAPPLPQWDPAVDAESTLTATVAGLTAMVIHAYLDGQQVPAGLSMELSLPWPRLTHRAWARHPACRCADSP